MVDSNTRLLGGRYEVRSLIGRGGMATVHLGRDTRLSRLVAIKMLRVDLARDSVFQARFRREAQAAASLNHPNIVAVYDTGEEPARGADGKTVMVPYIVMEYVEGHTVKELLSDGTPVPIPEAVEITQGVLSALEYAHNAGLVHRDIKPGNIMLTSTGKVKVMDFGIARAIADSQATMTSANAVVGTAQYLSPEQARGEKIDARSDVYSTGCVLFELLTGRAPFVGDSAVSLAYQHVSELPPVPSSIADDVPRELDQVVMKSMAKDPDLRYASAADMSADLNRASLGLPILAPPIAAWQMTDATAATQIVPGPISSAETATMTYPGMTRAEAQAGDSDLNTGAIPTQAPPKKSRTGLWVTIMLLLAAAVLGFIGYTVATSGHDKPQSQTTTVPTGLIGQDQVAVRNIIQNAKLVAVIKTGEEVFDETVPEGKVAKVDPSEGATVEVGSQVSIYLSKGQSSKAVPDVTNQPISAAQKTLESAGFVVEEVKSEDNPSVKKDTVIRTEPSAGQIQPVGSKIVIVASSGNVVIPDVTGQTEFNGKAELESQYGLRVDVVRQASMDTEPGLIMWVENVGTAVPQGSKVQIGVSSARCNADQHVSDDKTKCVSTQQSGAQPPKDNKENKG